jgi:hypothetical protein
MADLEREIVNLWASAPKLLDGTFQVESEPERGTTIRAVLPVQRRRSAQAA